MFVLKHCLLTFIIILFCNHGLAEDNDTVEEKQILHTCYGTFSELIVPMFNEADESQYLNDLMQDERFNVTANRSAICPHVYESENWYILENGNLYDVNDSLTFNGSSYCLFYRKKTNEMEAYICYGNDQITIKVSEDVPIFYSIGMIISCCFLLITFIIYAIFPDLQNFTGKCLMCFVLVMALGYLMLSIINLVPILHIGSTKKFCKPFGYFAYYMFIATYFWMNAFTIDICWTIKRAFTSNRKMRFLKYFIYVFGCTTVIVTFAFLMDLYASNYGPQIGVEKCWLNDNLKGNIFAYLYFPMLTLVCTNFVAYILTIMEIYKVQKNVRNLDSGPNMKHHKKRVWLFVRLFAFTGFTWILEFISVLPGKKYMYIFYASDFFNCIQGIFIFILFICKNDILQRLLRLAQRLLLSERGETFTKSEGGSNNSVNTKSISMAAM